MMLLRSDLFRDTFCRSMNTNISEFLCQNMFANGTVKAFFSYTVVFIKKKQCLTVAGILAVNADFFPFGNDMVVFGWQ